jgi:hypothetical protein
MQTKINITKIYRCGKAFGIVYIVKGKRCSTLVRDVSEAAFEKIERALNDTRRYETMTRSAQWDQDAKRNLERSVNIKFTSELVQEVAPEPAPAVRPLNGATDRQVSYIMDLIRQNDLPWGVVGGGMFSSKPTYEQIQSITRQQASVLIDSLKTCGAY